MIDIQRFRKEIDDVARELARKGYQLDIHAFNDLESKRKTLQQQQHDLQAKRNALSKEVGVLKRNQEDASSILATLETINEELKAVNEAFNDVYGQQQALLSQIPNPPHPECPNGVDENDNQVVKVVGETQVRNQDAMDHMSIGESWQEVLQEDAVTMAKSRFMILKGRLARLHRGLAQMMLDLHVDQHGYTEYELPQLVNLQAMYHTGQLPKFADDQFILQEDGLALIPTAEVPLTNLVANKILSQDELPLKMTAHTACFRREAGSYGKDTKGMIRQHQFDKVELVQVVRPEHSAEALKEMVGHAEAVLNMLELPYRVVALCTGDLGFSAYLTYDLEVWMPSQQTYREISSCSSCSDFQARRMQARFRDEHGQIQLLHTLNGSALAVGRTLIALLENHFDGEKLYIPKALRPYVGGADVF